jgi:hypothetical protein
MRFAPTLFDEWAVGVTLVMSRDLPCEMELERLISCYRDRWNHLLNYGASHSRGLDGCVRICFMIKDHGRVVILAYGTFSQHRRMPLAAL